MLYASSQIRRSRVEPINFLLSILILHVFHCVFLDTDVFVFTDSFGKVLNSLDCYKYKATKKENN